MSKGKPVNLGMLSASWQDAVCRFLPLPSAPN